MDTKKLQQPQAMLLNLVALSDVCAEQKVDKAFGFR